MTLSTEGPQELVRKTLFASMVAARNGQSVNLSGDTGAQMVEVIAVGTAAGQAVTFYFQGSFDGVSFYVAGYEQLDNQATPARAVADITLTPGNGTLRAVYRLLDPYPYIRMVSYTNTLSGTGAGLSATVYAVAV